MGLWDSIKKAYKRVDQAVGGYLPGGVSPGSSSSSSSSSTSSTSTQTSTSTSSTKTSSGGGSSSTTTSSGGTKITTTTTPAQTTGIIVTDYKSGESVKTVINASTGEIKSQTYNPGPGGSGSSRIGESAALSGANAGLTSQVISDIKNQQVSQQITPAQSASVDVSVQPNSISAAPQFRSYEKPYDIRDDMSFGEKVGYVFRKYTSFDFYSDVAQTLTGTGQNSQYPKPITAFTEFVSPFDIFGSTKTAGDVDVVGAYQGTGILNPETGRFEAPKKTAYDVLSEQAILNPDIAKSGAQLSQDISSGVVGELKPRYEAEASSLAAGYQTKINTGELTLDQAQNLYSTDLSNLQSRYESEATSLYEQRIIPKIDAANAFSQRYNELIQPVGISPSTGITIGGLVASSFFGGSEVAALRSAYRVVSGAVAVEGIANIGEGVAEKNYLKVGIGAAMFAGGTYSLVRSISNEITISRIQDVANQRPRIISGTRTELRPNQFMDQYSYIQKTSDARAFTRETVFSEFNPTTKGFKIISGSSETTIKTIDAWSGKDIFVGSYRTFSGSGAILPQGSFGVSTNIPGISIATEDFTQSLSRITLQTQYSYRFIDSLQANPSVILGGRTETILGGAESILKNDIIVSKSGPAQYSIRTYTGQGFRMFEDLGGSYSPDTLTFLRTNTEGKIYFKAFPNTGLQGNLPSGGGSSSTLTFQQLPSFSAGQALTKNAVNEIISTTAPGLKAGAASLPVVGAPGAAMAFVDLKGPQSESKADFAFGGSTLSEIQLQQRSMPQMQQVIPEMTTISGMMQIQQPIISQIPRMDQQQIPEMQQEQLQAPGFVTPGVGIPFNPFISPDLVIPGIPFFGDIKFGFPGSGKLPVGNQRFKYTPDFSSLIFDIRGKAPSGGAAPDPFAARPIPQGFSFAFSEGPAIKDIFANLQNIGRKRRRI